jgi:hypothetical protein
LLEVIPKGTWLCAIHLIRHCIFFATTLESRSPVHSHCSSIARDGSRPPRNGDSSLGGDLASGPSTTHFHECTDRHNIFRPLRRSQPLPTFPLLCTSFRRSSAISGPSGGSAPNWRPKTAAAPLFQTFRSRHAPSLPCIGLKQREPTETKTPSLVASLSVVQ